MKLVVVIMRVHYYSKTEVDPEITYKFYEKIRDYALSSLKEIKKIRKILCYGSARREIRIYGLTSDYPDMKSPSSFARKVSSDKNLEEEHKDEVRREVETNYNFTPDSAPSWAKKKCHLEGVPSAEDPSQNVQIYFLLTRVEFFHVSDEADAKTHSKYLVRIPGRRWEFTEEIVPFMVC